METYKSPHHGFVVFDIELMQPVFRDTRFGGLIENELMFTWNENIKEWQLNTWIGQPIRTQ
jgi:hypothetical protein